MERQQMKRIFYAWVVFGLLWNSQTLFAHPGHEADTPLKTWHLISPDKKVRASFLLLQSDRVKLSLQDGSTLETSLGNLSNEDQEWVKERKAEIDRLQNQTGLLAATIPDQNNPRAGQDRAVVLLAFMAALVCVIALARHFQTPQIQIPLAIPCILVLLWGISIENSHGNQDTKPAIEKAFEPFKGKINYRMDDNFFYVESNGIPDHPMMIGIRAWQQQVPIPQPYFGKNAWQIPLKPKMAERPVSAKSALFRGAIALAINGIPIFNPIKNDGRTDTLIAGELDEYGGHCGRADDYHYHIGPVHLQKIAGANNPIGYALDGFPLYGYTDANGNEPKDLDKFNGRMEKDGYKYYSTKKYPYINGGMRGEVQVAGDQVDPQPRANPIRPDGRPLQGAKITGFTKNESTKTNTLKYEINGKPGYVIYTEQGNGRYQFQFKEPNGKVTTSDYEAKSKEGKGGKKGGDDKKGKDKADNKKDDKQKKKGPDGPMLPWLGAHFEELDTDKDGFLTLEEIRKEVDKTFSGFDMNKDGKLTRDEYSGRGTAVRSALAGFVKGHSDEISDKDGTITRQSLLDAMTKMFEKADRKKSGKISKSDASQGGRMKQ